MGQSVGFIAGFAIVYLLLSIKPTDKQLAESGNKIAQKRVNHDYVNEFGKL